MLSIKGLQKFYCPFYCLLITYIECIDCDDCNDCVGRLTKTLHKSAEYFILLGILFAVVYLIEYNLHIGNGAV